jgi:nickel-type superoxide dismutase maturation protease
MRAGRRRDNGLIPLGIAVVSGVSMVPAYYDGDRLLVRYGGRVRTGDAVIARDPRLPERILVKRVAHREADGWWLLADNPYAPGDSRRFGAVPDELVLGRVLLRLRPLRRARPRPAPSAGPGAGEPAGGGPAAERA